VNGYEVLGPVAEGGREGGSAVRARRLADGAEVVLKRLAQGGSPGWLRSVATRAKAVAALGHLALPRIFEVTEGADEVVIVMEYARGGSLADRLAGGRVLPAGVVGEVFATLGEGLEAAHRAGILHLDLKPSNILFRANGDPFLSDFGHDRLTETTGQPTPGRAAYLDPVVAGGNPPDAQGDLYALAAMAYQALSGSPPFGGDSVVEVADAARLGAVRPLAEAATKVPAALAAIVERALAPNRERRYSTPQVFADSLLPGSPAPASVIADVAGYEAPPVVGKVVQPGAVVPGAVVPGAVVPGAVVPGAVVPGEVGAGAAEADRHRPTGAWRPFGLLALGLVAVLAAVVATPPLLHRTGTKYVVTAPGPVAPLPSPSPTPTPSASLSDLALVQASVVPTATVVSPSPSRVPPRPPPPKPAPKPAVVVAPMTHPALPPAPSAAPPPKVLPSPQPVPPAPLPPRGQRIAFTGTRDGRPSIYVTDVTGSVVIRLTNSPAGEDAQPVWSPDGTQIAFTSTRDGNRQIYVMHADGSGQHRLTTGSANHYDPTWDPTGASIAYVSDESGTPAIFRTDATGAGSGTYAGPAPASNVSAAFTQPSWSPDGKTFVATDQAGATRIVASWDVTGGGFRILTLPPAAGCDDPAWSPNGSKILYASGSPSQVWAMAADGSGATALTSGSSNNRRPTFSPAGDRIVFVSDRLGVRQLWSMRTDGSGQALLVNVAGEAYDPSWG